MMMRSSSFLRRVLIADAGASAATGMAMIAAAGFVDQALGLPATLLRSAGIALLPFAALVGVVATRAELPRAAVWAIIAANAVWVIDSVALLLSGWMAPTALGIAVVLGQAAAVAVFAELEYMGLRRTALAAA